MSNADELIRQSSRLFQRESQDSLWQIIAEQFYPERADFTTKHVMGEEFADHLFDATPVMLRRDLANSFSAMLRPRGQPWMRASVPGKEMLRDRRSAEVFFDFVTDMVRNALYDGHSQFVRATKEADHDYAAFGAAVISCEVNSYRNGLRLRNHHLKNCAWAENHQGSIDTMHRKMSMTARQMAQMFRAPDDSLHENVKKELDRTKNGNPEKEFVVLHIMRPREEYEFERRKRLPKDAEWVSLYIDQDNRHLIREAVSYEFRYVVPRWQTIQGSVYPISPATMTALPDARMLQSMARIMLEAAEKQVDPPLKATQRAIVGDVNFAASGITWVDDQYDERLGTAVEPFDLGKNVRLGVDMLMRTTAQLSEAMYVSKLNLPERGERTAYEMARRVEEYIRAAVPLFEPLETEYNVPLLDLAADILFRMNQREIEARMPPELSGAPIVWQFANPLQDALEKQKILAAETNFKFLEMASIFDQTVIKDYDVRGSFRDVALASGGPAEWVVPLEEANEAIAAELERLEAMQAMQAVQQAGMAAEQAGAGAAAVGEGAAMLGITG